MKSVALCAIALLLLSFSCNTTDPPPPPPQYVRTIELSAEDASCTETWLRVKITDGSQPPFDVRLTRDDQALQTYRLSTPDSLLIDEGLLPNQQYTYKAYRLSAGAGLTDSSTQVSITTMDTTSHNWVFDPPVLLGDGSSSVLYDVAIINDTLAYAVGEIYKRDSLGNWDPNAYNLVKWDGNTWELMRIQFYTFCGQSGTGSYPAKSIFAFSPTDIWIAMDGSQAVHWNGQGQSAPTCTPVSINKLWGDSSTGELYAVGNGGGIAVRNASGTWRRLESGTTLDVYDIYGSRNLRTGETEIYAVAAKQFVTFDRRILRVRSSGVEAVSDSTIPYSLHGVWFKGGGPYYVVGSGIYRKRDPMRSGPWQWLHPGVTPYYTYAIRGNDVNDIFICGSYGELLHFNGMQFRSHQNVPGFSALEFYELSCRNNLVVVVGYVQPRAVAVIGRRQ